MYKKGSEELREIAYTELGLADRAEREAWLQHPCTRAAIHTLQADVIDVLETWSNGGYTAEDTSGTIQLNSEALGQYKATENILNYMEGINDPEMFENDNS